MPSKRLIYGAPEGIDGRAVAREPAPVIWILRDESRLARARMSLEFFDAGKNDKNKKTIIEIPAFDCLPYDRFSPSPFVAAQRAAGLASMARGQGDIILTSLSAAMQRVPPKSMMAQLYMSLRLGEAAGFKQLHRFLELSGYRHVDIVSNVGEYALRGGLIDVYPGEAGAAAGAGQVKTNPVRVDFFGDDVEDMRLFDKDSQRSLGQVDHVDLFPASEIQLTEETIRNFRMSYATKFGFAKAQDRFYAEIIEGERVKGIEHFMPLFYPQMDTLLSYMPDATIILDDGAAALFDERWGTITTCHQGRVQDQNITGKNTLHQVYHPLSPEEFYIDKNSWEKDLSPRKQIQLSPFVLDDPAAEDAGGRAGWDFTEARKRSDVLLMDEVAAQIKELQKSSKRILLAAQNPAQHERLAKLLNGHNLGAIRPARSWREAQLFTHDTLTAITLDIERGLTTEAFVILCEEDIVGARPVRARQRGVKRARDQLMQGEAIQPGDLVVHADHGIGRFTGLRRVEAAGAAHDCLMIVYADEGRLFIPVENADLVSRYGAAEGEVALDRLGTSAWASRKERIKKKLWEMAGQLIALAASRQTAQLQPLLPPQGLYEEFCARFAFEETDDQRQAIKDVIDDLSGGRPMDRLICGDVGFGKTEVALRAAFISVMAGQQVAIIAPTTLLCRQHVDVFTRRFEGFPVNIGHLSRLVSHDEAKKVHAGLADGTIDIVIGTHALLSGGIKFHHLGLAVIDEEQHFGVGHKERLKEVRKDAHILTLTATPIPRTLQLALSGAREISLIGDPPAGRLAVHNFIGAFDPPTMRMALLREHQRGGRSFFICPRIRDLEKTEVFLSDYAPELSFVIAHGRLKPGELEENIGAFYDGAADILLSTHIVESGLDISDANTLIVWHANMFGLAQLHQLRGRIGRGKIRAYAYFTLPRNEALTPAAEERLRALNQMDQLGAGFALAARDLDIRGAGNLLGKDQSGHIREIGYELYQKMLAEAVEQRKDQSKSGALAEEWSPQVKISAPVMIPEDYIPDMKLRLAFYRHIATIKTREEIAQLSEDITDRFGALPEALRSLFEVVRLKSACRAAGVEFLDIGANGLRLAFYRNQVANLTGLVQFIEAEKDQARLSPDHRLLIRRRWPEVKDQFSGAGEILAKLEDINSEEQERAL